MSDTPRLSLPLVAAGQAQKHITVNEGLMRLDAIAQLTVESAAITTPPDPATIEGKCHIIPAGASGAWANRTGEIAVARDGAYVFIQPLQGWRAYVADAKVMRVRRDGIWALLVEERLPKFGVNTDPSDTNRLAVASPATLLTAEASDHRLVVNKASGAATASLVLQSGFSGRVELGLVGDDDFRIKVSDNGSTWREAIAISRATGEVVMPSTVPQNAENLIANPEMTVNQRQFAGGALAANQFGYDRWKSGASGANVTAGSGAIALASGAITQMIDPDAYGYPGLAGATLAFSVEDLTGGALNILIAGQGLALTAGAGRRGASVQVPPGVTGPFALQLSPASGAVSFRRPKLEIGASATTWRPRHLQRELALCQRHYFEMSAEFIGGSLVYDGYGDSGSALVPVVIPFPAPMRATPVATWTGTFNTTNILPADDPLVILTHAHCAVLRPRGQSAGRRLVTCSSGARLRFSADL
jgi:Protein of unknown function (DUF2793)